MRNTHLRHLCNYYTYIENNQLTFDDIEVDSISRSEIKQIVKESMVEVLNSLEWSIDPLKKTVTFRAGKDPR